MNTDIRYTAGAKLFICIFLSVGIGSFLCLLNIIMDL